MRTYRAVFKLRMAIGLQYRAAALAGMCTQFFWGIVAIMMFQAFYGHSTTEPPMPLHQLVTYLWLQQAFLSFIMLWFRDSELFNLITSGNIAYELCRPCGIYGFWFAKLVAQRLSSALLRCSPILVIAFLLPQDYRLTLPPDIWTFLLFVIILALGLLVLVSISMLIYISVFHTMSPAGSMLIFGILGEFFSGMIVPIPFMPDWLQRIAGFLPFRLCADLPFRVYSGNIPLNEAYMGLIIQLVWLAILVAGGYLWMRQTLQRVVIQGG